MARAKGGDVRDGRRHARPAFVAVLVALVATSCAFVAPAAVTERARPASGATVVVGPPGAHGDRVATVDAPSLAGGGEVRVTARVGHRPAVMQRVATLPAPVVLDGADVPDAPDVDVSVTVQRRGDRAEGHTLVDGRIRLNQLQVKGTHNSYHVAPTTPPFDGVLQWQYTHSPLPVQFESEGVRQIELDVYVDPAGHRVFHVPTIDNGTTCATYVVCLQQVKGWSDAHPHHAPIAILTELVDDDYHLGPPVLPWTAPAMDQLDAEIRSVFPPEQVLTPDDVRGPFSTLDAAIQSRGWPALDDVRGKVLFLMDNGGGYRTTYLAGHPTLAGRMLFTNSTPGQPDAAFVKMNDPFDTGIPANVAAGYVVRTRADADTFEARDDNTAPRDSAIASGATWVSTDFPVPGRAYGTPYYVSIPGGMPARCNPLNAPSWCVPAMVAG